MLKRILPSLSVASMAMGVALTSAAQSAETGLYIGAALGEANTHLDNSTFNIKDTNGAYKAIAGFRPLGLFAAELNYVDLGRASDNGAHTDTRGVDVMGLVFAPIPVVDLYGKVGLVNWREDAHSPQLSFHRSGSDLAYAVGAGLHFGAVGARLEYEKFDVSHASNLSLTSLGVTWTFL